MSEQATAARPPGTARKCAICREREATVEVRFGAGAGARLLGFCDEHAPVLADAPASAPAGSATGAPAKPRRTKNRLAATDHADAISALLYRLGGCTLEQATRWLALYTPGHFGTRAGVFDAARRTLWTMREQRQVDVISMRRRWLGKKSGRRENFFRLSKARSGAAIVEGAVAAEEDPATALDAYKRVWKSGGIDHAAHRADLYLLWAEEANVRDDVDVDPVAMTGETNGAFPLQGARAAPLDKGGERIKLKSNARPHYEEITPDGEWWGEFSFEVGDTIHTVSCPFWLELERKTDAGAVAWKMQKMCGYWLRRLDRFGEHLVRPMMVVHDYTRAASARGRKPGGGAFGLRREVSERLRSNGKGHFAKLDARLQGDYGWDAGALGRFLLFAQWEELYAAEDHFGAHYLPVSAYPKTRGLEGEVSGDGMTVGLKAVAVEHARLMGAMRAGKRS